MQFVEAVNDPNFKSGVFLMFSCAFPSPPGKGGDMFFPFGKNIHMDSSERPVMTMDQPTSLFH